MDATMLRADCAQCAGLCCVALAFDRSAMFAIDKPAGEACPSLSVRDRCTIHARRAEAGFAGCVQFDCLGAGQKVTAMFAGQSWRDGPDISRAMFDAFNAMRDVHALVELLQQAQHLPLSGSERASCRALLKRLDAHAADAGALAEFKGSGLRAEVMALLRQFRPAMTPR